MPKVWKRCTLADESARHDFCMQYVHLWVDAEGETHIKDAKMKGFELKKYAADPQFVKDDIEAPTKIVFTELAPGIEQDFHPCPEVQFVVCLAGAW